MKRREFITLLGSAAAWPFAVRAQQPMPVVGFLHQASAAPDKAFTTAFRDGLSTLGYVEGKNVIVEHRWAEGQYERLPQLAADLVSRKVSLIASAYTIAAVAAKAATSTIPILFVTGTDPIQDGLVSSLATPHGNVTGIALLNASLGAKRLGLLRDVLPAATTFALLINPTNRPVSESYVKDNQAAASVLGVQLVVLPAGSEREIEQAFAMIIEQRIGALIVATDAFLNSRQDQIIGLAARYIIPTLYGRRETVLAGGLMSYGTDLTNGYHEAGIYAGRILNGAKPSDLPVLQPTKFQFVLNLKTAAALGLRIPPDVLSVADEVIE
jgi:putative ABC transport system substrate-binding protein